MSFCTVLTQNNAHQWACLLVMCIVCQLCQLCMSASSSGMCHHSYKINRNSLDCQYVWHSISMRNCGFSGTPSNPIATV